MSSGSATPLPSECSTSVKSKADCTRATRSITLSFVTSPGQPTLLAYALAPKISAISITIFPNQKPISSWSAMASTKPGTTEAMKGLPDSGPILRVFSRNCRARITTERLLPRSSSTLHSLARAPLSPIPPHETAFFRSTLRPCSVLQIHSESRALISTPPLEKCTSMTRKQATQSMASTSPQRAT